MIKLQTDLVKLQADAPFIRFGRDSVLMAMARDSMVAHAYQEAMRSELPNNQRLRDRVEAEAAALLKSWGVE